MARATEKSQRMEFWLMHDGGTAVGTYRLDLPMLDNLDFAELALCIDPPHQRRGHGRALLAHAARPDRRARPAPGDRGDQRAGRRAAEPGDALRRGHRREPVTR